MPPFPSQCGDIRPRMPSSQILRSGHGQLKVLGLPWPDHCHIKQGAPGSSYSIGVTHLLPPGHWGHLVSPDGISRPTPSCFPIVRIGGQPYQLCQTQLHFQRCSFHAFLPRGSNLFHTLIGKRSNQSGNLYFLHFPHSSDPKACQ